MEAQPVVKEKIATTAQIIPVNFVPIRFDMGGPLLALLKCNNLPSFSKVLPTFGMLAISHITLIIGISGRCL
jgi:hypothetical protein